MPLSQSGVCVPCQASATRLKRAGTRADSPHIRRTASAVILLALRLAGCSPGSGTPAPTLDAQAKLEADYLANPRVKVALDGGATKELVLKYGY